MNREGLALLRCVIERIEGLREDVRRGDCRVIAAAVNGFMPADMQITPNDVYYALIDSPQFKRPAPLNSEVLRARIDRVPELFSARLNGDWQAIANELNRSPNPEEQVTLADVRAAMDVRVVPKPEGIVRSKWGKKK